MNSLSIRCLKAAFVCLALGVGLGVLFAFDRARGTILRPLHAELNLWGWVTLLIYGMAYHMLPRFAGRPLSAPQVASRQAWIAIGGVFLVSLGWMARYYHVPWAQGVMVLGGIFQLTAALLWVWLIEHVVKPA